MMQMQAQMMAGQTLHPMHQQMTDKPHHVMGMQGMQGMMYMPYGMHGMNNPNYQFTPYGGIRNFNP